MLDALPPPPRRWWHSRWAGVLAASLLLQGCAVWRLPDALRMARASEPLQVEPARARASLLVVGDSTAVGTGASRSMHSLVGRIAQDHPGLRIVNLAEDGARFEGIVRQLERADAHHGRFDTVLIMGGGNDVVRLTREEHLRAQVDQALAPAARKARHVVVMPVGNVGNAPFFFAPVDWRMTLRSRAMHAIVRDAASASGAHYVNLYREHADDPFAQRPGELLASDGLHPSDAGYALWYAELQREAPVAVRVQASAR